MYHSTVGELKRIQEYFKNMEKPMVESNIKQAMVPWGSEVIKNLLGTAPGIISKVNRKVIINLPGPPKEL